MNGANHLPQGWAKTTVGELVQFEYGKSLTKQVRDSGGNYVVFGSSGPVGKHSQSLIKQPCLVVGRKGAIGRVHISHLPCWPIDTTYFVIPSADLELRFVFHLLTWLRLGELDRSTAIPGLNRDDAYAVSVQLPPFPEQQRIVAKIEELFTQLDAGIEELRKAQAQLKRYRQAVLKAAVTGELTKEWREAHKDQLEPASELLARILKERRAKWEEDQLARLTTSKAANRSKMKYKEPTAPTGNGLETIAAEYRWATLDQLCPIFVDCAHRTPTYSDHGFPALRPRDVVQGRLRLAGAALVSEEEFKIQTERRVPEYGDIIYSRELSLGWGVEVPRNVTLCMSQGMVLFRPDSSVNRTYFLHLLNGEIGRRQAERAATGSAHPHINLGAIKAFKFPLCDYQEQEQIVLEIDRLVSIADAASDTIERGFKQAERLRQSILKQAFEGKLVPQDPNDEPAEVLLERIRSERAKREAERRAATKPRRRQGVRSPTVREG